MHCSLERIVWRVRQSQTRHDRLVRSAATLFASSLFRICRVKREVKGAGSEFTTVNSRARQNKAGI